MFFVPFLKLYHCSGFIEQAQFYTTQQVLKIQNTFKRQDTANRVGRLCTFVQPFQRFLTIKLNCCGYSKGVVRANFLDEFGDRLIEMIVPDWLYEGVIDQALVLTIHPDYFALTGGLERWLYRLVRKHGGHQIGGWSFDVSHLYLKSGVLSPRKQFAFDLRRIVLRQPLPGYTLRLETTMGRERLNFTALPEDALDKAARRVGTSSDIPAEGEPVDG